MRAGAAAAILAGLATSAQASFGAGWCMSKESIALQMRSLQDANFSPEAIARIMPKGYTLNLRDGNSNNYNNANSSSTIQNTQSSQASNNNNNNNPAPTVIAITVTVEPNLSQPTAQSIDTQPQPGSEGSESSNADSNPSQNAAAPAPTTFTTIPSSPSDPQTTSSSSDPNNLYPGPPPPPPGWPSGVPYPPPWWDCSTRVHVSPLSVWGIQTPPAEGGYVTQAQTMTVSPMPLGGKATATGSAGKGTGTAKSTARPSSGSERRMNTEGRRWLLAGGVLVGGLVGL